jgi:nicotinamidase-related amidase
MAKTALLLTGLQRAYCATDGALASGGLDVGRLRATFPALTALLAAARQSELPIIHLREMALLGGLSDSASWRAQRRRAGAALPISSEDRAGTEFLPEFEPADGEFVIERFRPGGLHDTRTDVILRSAQVRSVIVAGVETHRSLLATALQAVELDYHVSVPIETTASVRGDLQDAGLRVLAAWVDLRPVSAVIAGVADPKQGEAASLLAN